MNILFLSLLKYSSFDDRNIYTDLLRQFIKQGHNVYAVCPAERRCGEKTNLKQFGDSAILTVKTFNIQKTNVIEKGIGTVAIKKQFIKAIKKHLKGIKFDLILYPTPPITLYGVVKYFKKNDKCKTYLMLKDIFPQNAVDIGLLSKTGLKGFIYKYFRKQEKKLYAISDRIGCMSQANVNYIIEHNPDVDRDKIEVFPNCIEVQDIVLSQEEKEIIRNKYQLPQNKKIFVYGGNLGKPQGVPFIIDCLKRIEHRDDVFFLIVGDGTEFSKFEQYLSESNNKNVMLLKRLPVNEFDKVIASCDVGLIFLDHRFTIPNYPSRLLSYMQARIPVLACTDEVSDVGKTIIDGDFGWWCSSDDVDGFIKCLDDAVNDDLSTKGNNAFNYLKRFYNVSNVDLGDFYERRKKKISNM